MRSEICLKTFSLLAVVAILSGCSSTLQSKAKAEKAVENFHSQLNSQQFEQIYKDATPEYRRSTNLQESNELFSAIHRKLGNVKDAHETGFFVNVNFNGTFVRVGYNTQFESGPAQEDFTWRVELDGPRLIGYNVNSRALITR